jgi:hypothetical protein
MRMTVLGLAAALALAVPVLDGCGSGGGKASTTSAGAGAVTTTTGAAGNAETTTTAATANSTTVADATTTTTPAEAQESGDTIALSAALGYDLTNDDSGCIKQAVGDTTVALLDENDIGALPAKVQGDLFQALAKCARKTIVDSFVTALPGLLDVTEDQATCVGQAYVSIYAENRTAAEQGALTFDETDPAVQAYVREKLGACLPADKVDEFLSQAAG